MIIFMINFSCFLLAFAKYCRNPFSFLIFEFIFVELMFLLVHHRIFARKNVGSKRIKSVSSAV